MKYYIFTDYDSGNKFLFDNLDSAMEFVKDYQAYDMIGDFSLNEISVINPSFKDWLNGKADSKTLIDTCENNY